MWTEEEVLRWRKRSRELEIENEFRKATPEAIEIFKSDLPEDERLEFETWLKGVHDEYNYLVSLMEEPKPKKAPVKRIVSQKEFNITNKLEKLIKWCDEQQDTRPA